MKKYFLPYFIIISLSLIISSWGGVGHSKISESVALSFNQEMQQFEWWVPFLRDHSSDADYRKDSDPSESPKHYIDIDNYNDFLNTGRIPQTLDSAISVYGNYFVYDNGILPWATKATFDSLSNCLKRLNISKAKIFAADLGHYVADGHMPLHITRNYNGQYSGNTGIHSRYESTMISGYISQIVYTGDSAVQISDVNQYIFSYLYSNYHYADSILVADNYAKSQNSNYSSSTYKAALWQKSRQFTIPLFKNASKAFADLIYTAWVQAGSPSFISAAEENDALTHVTLEQNFPNPFNTSTRVNFTVKEQTLVLMQVRDMNGKVISTLANELLPAGKYSKLWMPANQPAGIYYIVLDAGGYIQAQKMIYCGNH